MQIQKYQHTQGSGRQLGNVQVVSFDSAVLLRLETTKLLHHTHHCLGHGTCCVYVTAGAAGSQVWLKASTALQVHMKLHVCNPCIRSHIGQIPKPSVTMSHPVRA